MTPMLDFMPTNWHDLPPESQLRILDFMEDADRIAEQMSAAELVIVAVAFFRRWKLESVGPHD